MATADALIDRRRLRRRLTFWRSATVAIAIVAILAAAWFLYRRDFAAEGDQIAKVPIDGTITDDQDLIARLEQIRKSPAVKGVILSVNSPGGTTVGGEAIFDEVRRVAAAKPVVTEVGTLAASAAYLISTAADHIVAHKTSIIGSIGVLIEYPDVTGLMDKLGIKLEAIKSSPMKAEPSPFDPTSDQARAMIRKLILDSYDWFVGLVAERRPLTRTQVLALADGSIFTGRQAVANKLIDEVGGQDKAVAWLATKGVDPHLPVVEWKPRHSHGGFLFSSAGAHWVEHALGLPSGSDDLARQLSESGLFLDGLLSVWHAGPKGLND